MGKSSLLCNSVAVFLLLFLKTCYAVDNSKNMTVRMVLTNLFDGSQAWLTKDHTPVKNKGANLEWLLDPRVSDIPTQVYVVDKQTTFNAVANIAPDLYSRHQNDPKAAHIRFVPLMNGLGAQECNGYLSYIISHYHSLSDVSIFVHSKPTEHNENILDHINEVLKHWTAEEIGFLHLNAGPTIYEDRLKYFKRFWSLLGFIPKSMPKELRVSCCSQFMVTREKIHLRPLWFYENFLELVYEPPGNCAFPETLWHIIFGEPPLLPDDRLSYKYESTQNTNWNITKPQRSGDVIRKPYLTMPLGKIQGQMVNDYLKTKKNGFSDFLTDQELTDLLKRQEV
jgi:hypothetical protein